MSKIDAKVIARLNDLIALGEKVKTTRFNRSGDGFVYLGDDGVNAELAYQYGASALNILKNSFGEDSDYYKKFSELHKKFSDHGPVAKSIGILRAAKDDYEGGYFFNARTLIQAEVFDDILEQAEYLLEKGYHQPAAVIGGAVLEDSLRQLCVRHGITLPKNPQIEPLNVELAKASIYNVLVQKQITALSDLRNKAAHGRWDEFTKADVANMLPQIRSFMVQHL